MYVQSDLRPRDTTRRVVESTESLEKPEKPELPEFLQYEPIWVLYDLAMDKARLVHEIDKVSEIAHLELEVDQKAERLTRKKRAFNAEWGETLNIGKGVDF